MADEKIIFKVIVDDEGNVTQLKATEKGFQDIDLTVKNASKSAQKLNNEISKTGSGVNLKSIKLTTKEYDKLAKTQSQLKNATGGATSAAMELGRVVSDAPYGIRGMANNITQLVSQLGYQAAATNVATGTTYGYVGALKAMWTAMMGPLGVVLAITTVISAFDFLYGANKKTETSTSDLKQEFEGFAEVLRNDVNASIEDYIELIKNKNKLDKTVNKASERYLEIEEEIASAKKNRAILEDFQAKQIALHGKASEITARDIIKLTKRENDLLAERKKLFLETGESINKLKEANDKYKESTKEEKQEETVVRGSVKWYKKLISARKQDRDDFSTTSKEYKKYTIEIEEYQKRLDKLTGETDPKSKVSVLGLNMIDPKKEVAKAKKRLEIFKKFATKSLFPDGKFIDFSKDPKTKLILFGEPTEEDLEEFKTFFRPIR